MVIKMNKTELIDSISEKTELTKADAEKAVSAFFETVAEALAKGEKVQLLGFGTFESKIRAARVGRNPVTGELIDIPETRIASFKAGKRLKDTVSKEE